MDEEERKVISAIRFEQNEIQTELQNLEQRKNILFQRRNTALDELNTSPAMIKQQNKKKLSEKELLALDGQKDLIASLEADIKKINQRIENKKSTLQEYTNVLFAHKKQKVQTRKNNLQMI